jgi:hypothetical protein
VTALPAAKQQPNNLANTIWIVGAIIAGLFSLVRIPPRIVIISVHSITGDGWYAGVTVHDAADDALEWIARARRNLTRVNRGDSNASRAYSHGPALRPLARESRDRDTRFALVRHPIYMGWLNMCAGYFLSFRARATPR